MQTIIEPKEFTQEEIAFRKACAYLKGYIVSHSVQRGMKWESKKEATEEFQNGFDQAKKSGYCSERQLTLTHIVYNRLRHNRPHLGSIELDNEYIATAQNDFYGSQAIAKLKEQLSSVLSEEEIDTLLEARNA